MRRGLAAESKREQWLAAMSWRRRVEAVVATSGLTFTQWLVLDATNYLIEMTEDAVSQSQVSAHLELDRMTLSHAMTALVEKGLVDRGGAMSGMAWRIFLTPKGSALLDELGPGIETASTGSPTSQPAPRSSSKRP